ncbi:uncharacterized protein LAESUDRAFT_764887 [Laetiporus sulphureus 93-53]|uniref:Uncharacterized protein n=1 Tax=Laetiporus sulphureus 93-53 TaxID=1314785 RepID=A0A165B2M9_9APHY|nr:uncharacterized protein LAESUDRAFT_764887 [Laetiporus sulphureus 93-53]KZT00109.1 hypothetical protein LAESUDRAFT_764887 [Laetiporus sulphureus 93-53]
MKQKGGATAPPPPKKSHKHMASIASLIRAEDRAEEGWSPIGTTFNIPPNPRADRAGDDARNRDKGKSEEGMGVVSALCAHRARSRADGQTVLVYVQSV